MRGAVNAANRVRVPLADHIEEDESAARKVSKTFVVGSIPALGDLSINRLGMVVHHCTGLPG